MYIKGYRCDEQVVTYLIENFSEKATSKWTKLGHVLNRWMIEHNKLYKGQLSLIFTHTHYSARMINAY